MEIPAHLRIVPLSKADNRLLLKVTLLATGRPTYQTIYCMNCGNKLGSIEGATIYGLDDVDDDSWEPNKPRLNVYCNGKYCHTWYRYTLN